MTPCCRRIGRHSEDKSATDDGAGEAPSVTKVGIANKLPLSYTSQ